MQVAKYACLCQCNATMPSEKDKMLRLRVQMMMMHPWDVWLQWWCNAMMGCSMHKMKWCSWHDAIVMMLTQWCIHHDARMTMLLFYTRMKCMKHDAYNMSLWCTQCNTNLMTVLLLETNLPLTLYSWDGLEVRKLIRVAQEGIEVSYVTYTEAPARS